MSPLSRLLLSHLSKKSIYSTICHVQAPSLLSLHVDLLDYGMHLCHGSKSSCCSSGETVGRVSLLISMTGSTTCRPACMDGESNSLSTANYGFIISLPNSTAGLGQVQFNTHSELGNAHSHAQSVYTWSMRHKLTMRLRSSLFER